MSVMGHNTDLANLSLTQVLILLHMHLIPCSSDAALLPTVLNSSTSISHLPRQRKKVRMLISQILPANAVPPQPSSTVLPPTSPFLTLHLYSHLRQARTHGHLCGNHGLWIDVMCHDLISPFY